MLLNLTKNRPSAGGLKWPAARELHREKGLLANCIGKKKIRLTLKGLNCTFLLVTILIRGRCSFDARRQIWFVGAVSLASSIRKCTGVKHFVSLLSNPDYRLSSKITAIFIKIKTSCPDFTGKGQFRICSPIAFASALLLRTIVGEGTQLVLM